MRTHQDRRQGVEVTLRLTGMPALATRLMYIAFDVLEFVLPKRTRSEHWPL